MAFYTFNQNNSGGEFIYDEACGISTKVIVEGNNKEEIIARAERIGLYFDGAGDCNCCGDRWYAPWDDMDLDNVPNVYGEEVAPDDAMVKSVEGLGTKWMGDNYEGFIHYLDGRVEGFWKEQDTTEYDAQYDGRNGYGGIATATGVEVFPVGAHGFAEDGNRTGAWEYFGENLEDNPAPTNNVIQQSPYSATVYKLYSPDNRQWVEDNARRIHNSLKVASTTIDHVVEVVTEEIESGANE